MRSALAILIKSLQSLHYIMIPPCDKYESCRGVQSRLGVARRSGYQDSVESTSDSPVLTIICPPSRVYLSFSLLISRRPLLSLGRSAASGFPCAGGHPPQRPPQKRAPPAMCVHWPRLSSPTRSSNARIATPCDRPSPSSFSLPLRGPKDVAVLRVPSRINPRPFLSRLRLLRPLTDH